MRGSLQLNWLGSRRYEESIAPQCNGRAHQCCETRSTPNRRVQPCRQRKSHLPLVAHRGRQSADQAHGCQRVHLWRAGEGRGAAKQGWGWGWKCRAGEQDRGCGRSKVGQAGQFCCVSVQPVAQSAQPAQPTDLGSWPLTFITRSQSSGLPAGCKEAKARDRSSTARSAAVHNRQGLWAQHQHCTAAVQHSHGIAGQSSSGLQWPHF